MYYIYKNFETSLGEILETSLGEIFTVPEVVEGAVHIVLYKNKSEPNRVSKDLEKVSDLYGVIRSEVSISNIQLEIEYNKFIDFNYIYIEEFDRYYYVSDYLIVRHNLYELNLDIDVLMSYSKDILLLNGFVERNEHTYNYNIIDKKRIVQQGIDISEAEVPNNVFTFSENPNDTWTYIMSGYKMRAKVKNDA